MKLTLFLFVIALVAFTFALLKRAIATHQSERRARRPRIGNINRTFFRQHMRKVYLMPLLVERFAAWLGLSREPSGGIQFANVGEGTHEKGHKTYLADAATTSRYLIYEQGSTADNCKLALGTNEPLGVSDDQPLTNYLDEGIAIKLFGATVGTTRMISDGTVTNGSRVALLKDGTGRVTVPGGGAGNFRVVGKAIIPSDANITAGEPIEVIPFQPVLTAY